MTDTFSPEKRKQIMSSIRSKNSRAELIVFKYLRKKKIYFQTHYNRAPGKPDIALPRKKLACFIDGDFWHGRHLERLEKSHSSDSYWVRKISSNLERDVLQRSELINKGWRVLSVWESDIIRKRTQLEVLAQVEKFLTT